jgi:hypothetical protein
MTRLLLGLVGLAVLASPANAAVFFDDFDDGVLSSDWETVTGEGTESIAEAGGVLSLSLAGGAKEYAAVRTVNQFTGDFDMEVDFDLTGSPHETAWSLDLKAQFSNLTSEDWNWVAIKRYRSASWDSYEFYKYTDGVRQSINIYSTAQEAGKIRLTRTGVVFNAYYWDGAWMSLGSTSHSGDAVFAEPSISSDNDYPAVTADYDNFQMTADGIVPEPASFSLLALGGLVWMRRSRRR